MRRWGRDILVIGVLALLFPLLPSRPLPTAAEGPQPPPSWANEPAISPIGPWQRSAEGWYYANANSSPPSAVVPLTVGGPDDYGYTWNDAVPFNWIDASTGTDTGLTGSSYGKKSGPVTLPFSFKYYANSYTQIYIAAAGFLTFGDQGTWPNQSRIPSPGTPNNVIAPSWSLTYVPGTGWVRYLSGGSAPNRYFVVEWHDINGGSSSDSIGADDTYRFEVVLYEDGDILFQYGTQTYNGSWWCGSAGIEDSEGTDGLSYFGPCGRAPSNKAVRFSRPAPAARLKIDPLYQGSFTRPGDTVSFSMPIVNTGELGSDTYDVWVNSPWPATIYRADGVTLLTDTDGDSLSDTGSVAAGATATVVIKVQTPGTAQLGSTNDAVLTVRSSRNTGKVRTPSLRATVPAPFAQAYRDTADGAMSLYLARPTAQATRKASANSYSFGSYMAVAETPSRSFVYVWNNASHCVGSPCATVSEIAFALVAAAGEVQRPIGRLTDLSGATVSTYDYPVVAVAPNGRIGVLWERYLSNGSQSNYNIFFAGLDAAGSPTTVINLTNNDIWGSSSDLDVPRFFSPRIVATDDNRFVVAWQRELQESGGYVDDMYFAIRDSAGGEVRSATQLTADTAGTSDGYWSPALARLAGGRALLGFQRVGSYGDVYYSVLDSGGNVLRPIANLSNNGISPWDMGPAAVQLSDGKIVIAWRISSLSSYLVTFAVLDSAFNRIAGPTTLSNPPAVTGDGPISLTADTAGHAILTWGDSTAGRNLYYALVDGGGNVLTLPTVFLTSRASSPNISTSSIGYGNTTYGSYCPPNQAPSSPLASMGPAQTLDNRLYLPVVTRSFVDGCS